nr:MAG TPA_asm: hypothetical protein [Caudoviricetes sp.]
MVESCLHPLKYVYIHFNIFWKKRKYKKVLLEIKSNKTL